jgi:hypothetical protein
MLSRARNQFKYCMREITLGNCHGGTWQLTEATSLPCKSEFVAGK